MQVKRTAAIALMLSLTACPGFPFFAKRGEGSNIGGNTEGGPRPPPVTVLELQKIEFDGETLSGRFLIGVEEGKLTLDKRLLENVSVQVRAVSDCKTGQPISFILADSFPEPAREADLLTLSAGQWYGSTLHFLLFDQAISQKSAPECFDAELWLKAADGAVAGRLRARAARVPRQEAADAGEVMPGDGGIGKAAGPSVQP